MLPTKFKSFGLLVQEEKRKISNLIYPSPWSDLSLFNTIGLLFKERSENRFSRLRPRRPSWIPDQNDLAIFDLQVTPMPPTKFQVSWPFGSGEEAKNKFSRGPPRRSSWISDRNDFCYFWSTSHPDTTYQVSSQPAFLFRRTILAFLCISHLDASYSGHLTFKFGKRSEEYLFWSTRRPDPTYQVSRQSAFCLRKEAKIDFQDCGHGGHLGFPIGTILAVLIYKSPRCFLPSFKSIGPSGEEAKNIFSRWPPRRPSWISDRNNFSYFYIYKSPRCFLSSSSPLAQVCRRSRLLKQIFDAARRTTHDARGTTDDGHWPITITHLEHFVLRWVNKRTQELIQSDPYQVPNTKEKDRQIQLSSHKMNR